MVLRKGDVVKQNYNGYFPHLGMTGLSQETHRTTGFEPLTSNQATRMLTTTPYVYKRKR